MRWFEKLKVEKISSRARLPEATGRFRDSVRGIWYNKYVVNQYTKRVISNEDIIVMIQLYTSGVRAVEIANMFQCGPRRVRQALKDAGVILRQHPLSGVPTNSPLEARLHDALKLAGIGFATHRRHVKNYVTDITINQAPIIIEADGIQHTWDDYPERDAIRDATHAEIGFRTFRFSGSEIIRDAKACIQHVIDECELVPDQDPIYDIRVTGSGKDSPSYIDDRQEYPCDMCGKPYIARKAYRDKWRTGFCSDECYQRSKPGRTLTQEHKNAVAEAGKGRVVSQQTRDKISASLTGKPHSPERIAAITAGRWPKNASNM